MILIVADAFDTHADVVEEALVQAGVKCVRLNLDVPSLRDTLFSGNCACWTISQRGRSVSSDEVSVVWPRRLTVNLNLEQQAASEELGFRLWRNEWNRALYGFYFALRNSYWMNRIQEASLADNKFFQMSLAREVGFSVPETIESNDKQDLLRFASRHGRVALKFLSQEMYKQPDGDVLGIYVNAIDVDQLSEFGDARENPVVLQAYVSKAFEVRYTFVDGKHLVCRIDSQSSVRASVDWRRYDIPHTPHSVLDAPREIRAKVDEFMGRAGLTFGALDFIVDPDGQWWFLEVNTSGQWLWIEDLVGLPISDSICESLIRRYGASK